MRLLLELRRCRAWGKTGIRGPHLALPFLRLRARCPFGTKDKTSDSPLLVSTVAIDRVRVARLHPGAAETWGTTSLSSASS